MRKDNIKVIVWGLGSMGKGVAEMLLNKKGVEISGAVVRGDKIGKSMYDFLDMERGEREDLLTGSFEDVVKEGSADIAVIATDSFTKDNFDKIKYCLERKINVVSTAEEMAYAKAQEPDLEESSLEIVKGHIQWKTYQYMETLTDTRLNG